MVARMACIAGNAGGKGTAGTAAVGCIMERKAKRKSLSGTKKHGIKTAGFWGYHEDIE
jgi:hypothetical protein